MKVRTYLSLDLGLSIRVLLSSFTHFFQWTIHHEWPLLFTVCIVYTIPLFIKNVIIGRECLTYSHDIFTNILFHFLLRFPHLYSKLKGFSHCIGWERISLLTKYGKAGLNRGSCISLFFFFWQGLNYVVQDRHGLGFLQLCRWVP